jgi:1-deoxy-D-xylulose 5-phosphate reductoisomerase
VAVHSFLDRHISFQDIPHVVESVLDSHEPFDVKELAAVLEADEWARGLAREAVVKEGVA